MKLSKIKQILKEMPNWFKLALSISVILIIKGITLLVKGIILSNQEMYFDSSMMYLNATIFFCIATGINMLSGMVYEIKYG